MTSRRRCRSLRARARPARMPTESIAKKRGCSIESPTISSSVRDPCDRDGAVDRSDRRFSGAGELVRVRAGLQQDVHAGFGDLPVRNERLDLRRFARAADLGVGHDARDGEPRTVGGRTGAVARSHPHPGNNAVRTTRSRRPTAPPRRREPHVRAGSAFPWSRSSRRSPAGTT